MHFLDVHRHLLPAKRFACGLYGLDYLEGEKRLQNEVYVPNCTTGEFERKSVFRALVGKVSFRLLHVYRAYDAMTRLCCDAHIL